MILLPTKEGRHWAAFAVDNPTPIQLAIPEAKHKTLNGKEIVAVPYTVEHTAVMRRFGLDAPSPITHRYDWPGRFTPFQHQYETSRFLTENRRAYVLNGLGCIEGDAIISANRRGKTFKISLRELHKKWNKLPTNSLGNSEWKCRSLKGDRFGLNKINDVIFKGYKHTLLITLEDGKKLRMTPDHKMAQPDGSWVEAGNLLVGDYLVTNGDKKIEVVCRVCGKPRLVKYVNRSVAAKKMCRLCKHDKQKGTMSGENNPSWRGGKPFIDPDGYVRILLKGHHRSDKSGRVYEHIVVGETLVNHPITKEYHVHHKNGVKHDNRPENLEILLASDHHRQHDHVVKLDGGRTINGGVVVITPKKSRIVSIEDGGVVDVYDLSMEAPHHNFVVNGVVVHNSGKTSATIWAADFLLHERVIRKVLVVAPLSCLERVWGDALYTQVPHRRFVVLHGSKNARLELLKRPDWEFAIVNHHGIEIIKDSLPADVDLIISDEHATFRNRQTKLWAAMKHIITPHRWVWALTGSPTPNAPYDAYAQSKLVTPERYNGSFTKFKCDTMLQLGPFKFVPRKNSEMLVNQILQPSIRYALEDCVDLPPTIYQEREAEMSKEQKASYLKLQREAVAEIKGVEVTAVNAAVLCGKLVQCAVGTLYDSNGENIEIDFGPRLQVIEECIEEAGGKCIIFSPLTGYLHALNGKLNKKWSTAVIEGSTSANKRNEIFKEFQTGDSIQLLIANPATMAHGLTLTAAATIIWAAPITSHEYYFQANARIVRPGQTKTTNIIHISASPVEKKIYEVLRERSKFQNIVLELAKGG